MAVSSSKEPNLTPFIDLLSILVCFLMMTAAWVYLDAFQSSLEKPPSESDSPSSASSEPKPDEKPKAKFSALVKESAVELTENERRTLIPHLNSEVDVGRVTRVLEDWRQRHPNRKDIKLLSENAAFYGDVIAMFDVLTGAGWSEVAMNAK
jgi:biopolymer transport protein ExbD